MPSFREQTSRISVNLVSPDMSVTGSFNTKEGLTISIDDRKFARHSDESLAKQVSAVIQGAGRGSKAAHEKIREQRHGPPPPEQEAEAARARRKNRTQQINQLQVRQLSRNGFVHLELKGGDEVNVRIKPGTVGHAALSAETLSREINETLALAVRQYARSLLKMQRE